MHTVYSSLTEISVPMPTMEIKNCITCALILFLLSVKFVLNAETGDQYTCITAQGQVRGKREKDADGNKFISFMGIPYAKSTSAERRFKAPEDPEKWEGIFNATREPKMCYALQPGVTKNVEGFGLKPAGSEDCLAVNVFTRKILKAESQPLKPVMIFIHGGAFFTGSSMRLLYGPEYLMTEDIVLVTFNYRLIPLGFVNFQDPSLSDFANAGMKDMIKVLKWVQTNIRNFGGDPNLVTLFGESAGSASTHYIMLSPLAKGLFHRVIMESGVALNPWTQGENDPRTLAKSLGFQESDEKKILKYLQSVSASDILKTYSLDLDLSQRRPYCVAVEKPSREAFISQDALDTIKSGNYVQVPMMLGYNNNEGLLIKTVKMYGDSVGIGFNVNEAVPHTIGYQKFDSKFNETGRKLYEYYKIGDDLPKVKNYSGVYTAATDIFFLRGIYETIIEHRKTSKEKIYFYQMSVESRLNVFKALLRIKDKGASHADDIGYLFKTGLTSRGGNDTLESKYSRRFVKMWTNFARTGNPTPDPEDELLNVTWKPVTENEMNYLEIGEELVMGKDPDIERMRFWDTISEPILSNLNLNDKLDV